MSPVGPAGDKPTGLNGKEQPVFRCQMCGSIVAHGIRSHKIVVQTREKTYEARGTRPRDRRPWQRNRRRGRSTRQSGYDKGGHGREIVQELVVCPECARQHEPTEQPVEP